MMLGRKFGELTVLHLDFGKYWKCQCSCGIERSFRQGDLLRGRVKNCGCCIKTKVLPVKVLPVKHGLFRHPLYPTWAAMINRCNNPATKSYKNYGGRGLTVCPEWSDVSVFISDMGDRPYGMSLDRRDNNLGYSPENCRWATPSEQNMNRRVSYFDGIRFNGRAWVAMIQRDNVNRHLGTFATKLEAANSYSTADTLYKAQMISILDNK